MSILMLVLFGVALWIGYVLGTVCQAVIVHRKYAKLRAEFGLEPKPLWRKRQ